MIASHPDTPGTNASHCPIPQMTFGEVLRYLQGGYETPVHRAITTHLMYCNACAEQLERIKAARRLGHHAMTVHMEAETLAHEVVADDGPAIARMAAYLEGNLPTEEAAAMETHLRTSHQLYRHFAAVQQELAVPVAARFKTPAAALAAVRWPVAAPAQPGLLARLQQRMRAWLEAERTRWLVPAFAVATCVLLVLTLLPTQPEATILPLTAAPGIETDSDQVGQGKDADVIPEVPVVTLLIPKTAGEQVRFTWPTLSDADVIRYRVGVYETASATLLFPEVHTTENHWEVKTDRLPADTPLTMLVMAEYEDGGVRAVVQQQVQRAR